MVVIETSIFTKQVQKIMSDEEYRVLQSELVKRPDSGAVIPQSGGLRKIRWPIKGRGKRSGTRTIYYWANRQNQLLMLLIYPKNVQDNMTSMQLKLLQKIVESEYNE